MWGTRVLGIHLYKYGVFMNWLSRRASQLAALPHLWTSPCAIWPSALSELRDLIGVVLVNEPNSIVPQLNAEIDHVMFTDASNTLWRGALRTATDLHDQQAVEVLHEGHDHRRKGAFRPRRGCSRSEGKLVGGE